MLCHRVKSLSLQTWSPGILHNFSMPGNMGRDDGKNGVYWWTSGFQSEVSRAAAAVASPGNLLETPTTPSLLWGNALNPNLLKIVSHESHWLWISDAKVVFFSQTNVALWEELLFASDFRNRDYKFGACGFQDTGASMPQQQVVCSLWRQLRFTLPGYCPRARW